MVNLVGWQRNRNNVPCDNSYEYYKRVIWLQVLDCMLVELHSRYGHHCKSVLRMSALIASKCVTMDFSELSECIDVYGSFWKMVLLLVKLSTRDGSVSGDLSPKTNGRPQWLAL